MKPTVLSAILAVTTLVGAGTAWHEHRCHAAALASCAAADADLARVEKRLRAAEARVRSLEAKVAVTGGPGHPPAPAAARHHDRDVVAQVDAYYRTLFRQLGVDGSQRAALAALLLEKQLALGDLGSVARQQGIDLAGDPDAHRALVAATQQATERKIHALLGEAGYAQYRQYQSTLPLREVTARLHESLAFVGTGVTNAELARMDAIVAQAFELQ